MQTLEPTEHPAVAPPRSHPPHRVRSLGFWAAALIVIGLDQSTKAIVRASLERGESWDPTGLPIQIRYVTNSGAAFGILQDQTMFLIAMTLIGLVAIYLYYRNPPFDHWVGSVAIGLMLGGALGNMIDRVRLGRVTDWIDPDRFPALNIADACINVGVFLLIVGYLMFAKRHDKPPEEESTLHHEDAPADA